MDEMITLSGTEALLSPTATKMIAEVTAKMKELKEKEDALKNAILNEMESKGVIKLDNDIVSIKYIASTDRESFDSKKFRAEQPDMYDEYVRISPVKASVRIKVK